MAMQLTENFVVPYGIPNEWNRSSSRCHRRVEEKENRLPKDPRQWSKEHVLEWLKLATKQLGLAEIAESKFAMNGKALCLMSPQMFLARVPNGGKLLYKDFQVRLCAALYAVNKK